MSFSSDLARFSAKVKARNQAVFVGTVAEAKTSIVEGSVITGAPGQPVDTANLRNSWQVEFPTPTAALISTNVEYADDVEDNVRDVTFKNHGPHSVKLTVAGLHRIVELEAERLGDR